MRLFRILVCVIVVVFVITIFTQTGFLQPGSINEQDLQYLDFDKQGLRLGADDIIMNGSSTCWVMVHGYTSTPDELRVAAEAVHRKFNDTVYVPRLLGHGMVSSALLNYSVEEWYLQVREMVDTYQCSYVLGSSMGGVIALRVAEERHLDGIVAVGPGLEFAPSYVPDVLTGRLIPPLLGYMKKSEPYGTIADPVERVKHLSGYSFPLHALPQIMDLADDVRRDVGKFDTAVLFIHARDDTVITLDGSEDLFEDITSPKEFVVLEQGDHIVFRDFDHKKAIDAVLRFRNSTAR